ncbi:MAG: Ig-like domain-containing protein, partial [Candidatus Didemnitutus sp.]|nr:Ig-like domain-containing protein [Candidatus Didemnitutus sp.]
MGGGAGRDTLVGGSGTDALDGGGGVDVARFSGRQSDYRITTKADGTVTVTDQRPGATYDGIDTLSNIERLYFVGDNTTIYLTPNIAPVAGDDAGSAAENSGLPSVGNVLGNDSDADLDPLNVASVRTGAEAGSGTAGTVGAALAGAYGSLTLNADGSYSYVVDNANSTVNALNATQSLTDNFTYAVSDGNGGSDQATLAITITGANDAPVAANDAGSATEAGTAAGSNASGNVLSNDSDVDNGDTKAVASVRTGAEAGSGTAGTVGAALAGAYGSLTLNADGSYSYVVDNANTTVNALNATQSLTDNFTYAVSDGNGGSDLATLAITITGTNDAPVAADEAGSATEAGTAAGANARGNVLSNDSDVDSVDTKSVATVRTGTEAGSGTAGTVGAALVGAYGSLTLNADG